MTIPLRILLTIGCALLGFLFPPMFLLAACIGWSIYEDITNQSDKIANAPPSKPEPMTRARMGDDAPLPAPKQIKKCAPSSEPVGIRNVLGVIAKGIEELDRNVTEMTARTQISCFLAKFFQTMEIILKLTSETIVLDIQIARKLGIEMDDARIRKIYIEIVMQICSSIDNDITARADIYADLPILEKAISTEYGREHFDGIAENVVERHLENLAKFHDVVFPDSPAFSGGRDGILDAREVILNQLRAICFDDADPAEFAHPYKPPVRSIFFHYWWVRNVAGGKPIIRKTSKMLLAED